MNLRFLELRPSDLVTPWCSLSSIDVMKITEKCRIVRSHTYLLTLMFSLKMRLWTLRMITLIFRNRTQSWNDESHEHTQLGRSGSHIVGANVTKISASRWIHNYTTYKPFISNSRTQRSRPGCNKHPTWQGPWTSSIFKGNALITWYICSFNM